MSWDRSRAGDFPEGELCGWPRLFLLPTFTLSDFVELLNFIWHVSLPSSSL